MEQRGGNGDKIEKNEESPHESRENQSAGRVVLVKESGRAGQASEWTGTGR